MKLFGKFKKNKLDDSSAVLKRAAGRRIRFVGELDDNNVEVVIGKGGRVIITDTEIIVNCGGEVVFSCPIETAVVSELLSMTGIRITGECNGIKRSVTAYWVENK